ncbi:MAG: hypothetical protein K6F33_12750 [Bacteroidales bacterium]|nr:hypothetical protein [Bacteroidales bacterium]
MKTLKYIPIIAAVALYACSPEEHDEFNFDSKPSASDINVDLQMLDSNKVVFNLTNPGCTPVWYFSDGSQSSVNGILKQFPVAGDYSVEVKMYNRNGLCDGSIVKEFSFTETYLNFDSETAKLTGGDEAVWMIAKDEKAHIACGENADNAAGWWSAQPGEKAATGLYDDSFTFKADGTYIYNPGADGLTYINVGTSVFGNSGADADYDVATEPITGKWNFEYRGSQLYLVLSPKTVLGYLAADAQWEKPEFIVKQVSAKKITLVWASDAISWQYIIVPFSEAPQVENLWNDNLEQIITYYNPGWAAEIFDQLKVVQDGSSYKVTAPLATSDTWQTQVKLFSTVGAAADKNYDLSVIMTPNATHDNVTVKLTDSNSDENFLFAEKVKIEAGKPNEIKFEGVKGIDAEKLTLVFDFGWNPENFEVEISDIVFNEHAGAIEEEPVAVWEYNEAGDLTKDASYEFFKFYAFGDSWSTLNTNVLTDNGDGTWTYFLPDASSMQWQAQLGFLSQIETSADKKYDFHVKLISNTDVSNVTVKVTAVADDNVILVLYDKGVNLVADEEFEIINNDVQGVDIPISTKTNDDGSQTTGGVKFIFDFGGNPANTEITISEMILQESK